MYRSASNSADRQRTAGAVLLTGGTGFLGSEIIPRLISGGQAQAIYLLIRGDDHADGNRRFCRLIAALRLRWPDLDFSSLRLLHGDITLPCLGLNRENLHALQGTITRIIHAAASTRLNSSLAEARRINLGGAREMLRLAESCRRLESLAWISTAYVAGDREGRILESELRCGQRFHNAYEQSKFEAELTVRSVMSRLPVTIFRPSIIVGDSRDGYTCNFASIYWPLRLIAKGALRRIPGDPGTPLDLVPVDYVANAIAQIMEGENAIGRCFQLVSGRSGTISARSFLERAIRRFDHRGTPLCFVSTSRGSDSRLGVFFSYLRSHKAFDDANTRLALKESGLRCPPAAEYLDRLFDFCELTDWGTQHQALPSSPGLRLPSLMKGAVAC